MNITNDRTTEIFYLADEFCLDFVPLPLCEVVIMFFCHLATNLNFRTSKIQD